jgi:hypothetical protein
MCHPGAAEDGHLHIQQHDIRETLPREPEPFLTIETHTDLVSFDAHEIGQRFRPIRIVVDDEQVGQV